MPRRKPQVIRHITPEEEEESDELPEVPLEPSESAEEVEIPDEEEAEENYNDEVDNEVVEVEDDDAEVIEDDEEEQEEKDVKLVNGDSKVEIRKDEKGNEILPDGTLVLQPEEVSEENDEFSGPEFKKSKKPSSMSDLEGTYKCTSCHEQLNHNNPKHVAKHALLGVLLCRQCYKYLSSGNFDIDDEGSEDQCTWCGEGGNLICCDSCPKAFCRSCIKTNLGRTELSEILNDEEEQWLCYVCNPAALADLREECDKVMFHLKQQSEAKEQKAKPKSANTGKNKKTEKDAEGNELLKVMQLIGNKSSKSKNFLEDIVKGKSPKGLKKTLDLFKDLRKLSEDLETRIRSELNEDEEEEKSSTKSSTGSEKNKHSTKDAEEEEDTDKSKSQSEKELEEESEVEDKKKSKKAEKKSKEKHGKAASTSPSEDDVPGTSSGSVKGNKSGRKGRRSLFKAQQKEKSTSSSDESEEESSEDESSAEDSDWEEDSGVKERRRRRASKKGKAGGKLTAKKGREGSSSDEDDSDDRASRKKKKKKKKSKSKGTDSDPEIQFPKKKKKKKKGPGADSSNMEEDSSDEEDKSSDKTKKKRTQKSKKSKSKDGDISLSSNSDEEESEEESDSEASSAAEERKKIKKAMQDAKKGTGENKQDLGSDAEDKIAERLLMEEAEEEEDGAKASDTSDSDLEDAKKKRDKRNKKKNRKRKQESDDGDDDENDEEDEERPKKKKDKKKMKKKVKSEDKDEDDEDEEEEEEEEDEEDEPKSKKGKKKSKKKKKHHLLQVQISASESDDDGGKKKKKKKPARKKKKEDSDDLMTSAESSSDSSDVQPKKKGRKRKSKKGDSSEDEVNRSYKKKKKRRRIKDTAASGTGSGSGSDSGAKKSDASVKEASGSDSDNDGTPGKHRKQIRKVLKKSKLLKTTLEAEIAEKERRERIKARRKELFGEEEAPAKVTRLKELTLEYGKDKKDKLVQVDKEIVKHLKPHQVEGVQFLWDSTFESLEKKDEPGGGAILAHCMGLGKTLQIITYLHTVMSHKDMNIKRALVVAPLNTVLNWVEEFNKWLSHDDSIDVYEITSIKNNDARADMLEQWHEEGGVLIMGYSMYRILALNQLRKKRLKRIFKETLVDPGPDIVVCDEGHMLKNSSTAIAKALNSVKTRRRVCLTGTPLQNNLIEYHCMVDFVKPNLLGSAKEYKNRFVNPITNGQCSDSTSRDVRIMKHRAHILHDLLAGCVQRKDYSVITKFLPPKCEYVLSIRLHPKQIKLYEVYLGDYSGMRRDEDGPRVQQRSCSVFADYQSLMRIWTHPQVLRLNTIREENKAWNDIEADFVDSDDSAGSLDDFINDDSDSDDDVEEVKPKAKEVVPVKLTGTRATRSSRRTAAAQNGNKGSSDESDGDDKKDGNKSDSSLEIINTWKTRSRTLDPEGDKVAGGARRTPTPTLRRGEWYEQYFNPDEDAYDLNLSGKLVLLFEVLKYCETIGEKILVFSQSLLSLDLIEDFLEHLNKLAEEAREKGKEDLKNQIGGTGAWIKGEDYFRMDGSTSAAYRHRWCDIFNDVENIRARLFLISTKAGSLGVNLVGANRVIIFDASWNPSHDTQSIFRVYRFGQERPVFIYRFVAQGTMEEKIYERQVAKQSLSQRVVDEHQIERHFSAGQLQELYTFTPDRLDDPDRKEQPLPTLPKDHLLADMLKDQKDWIVKYHEHDSLLENKIEEELSEEERKKAWEEYNNEKEGRYSYAPAGYNVDYRPQGYGATPMMLQRLYEDGSTVLQTGQSILGQQQYRNISLNGYNPYGWPSNVYAHSQAINGQTYRVPVSQYDQQLLMRQYQALQQQRQRNLQMMPQGTAGNTSVSSLLAGAANYASGAGANPASYSNSMSNLLSRMSQQQTAAAAAASSGSSHIGNLAGMQTSNLYEALKKTAEKQKEQQQQNGNGNGHGSTLQ